MKDLFILVGEFVAFATFMTLIYCTLWRSQYERRAEKVHRQDHQRHNAILLEAPGHHGHVTI